MKTFSVSTDRYIISIHQVGRFKKKKRIEKAKEEFVNELSSIMTLSDIQAGTMNTFKNLISKIASFFSLTTKEVC